MGKFNEDYTEYFDEEVIHERQGRFAFEVTRETYDDTYQVNLPHQCDNWDIARDATRDEAIEKLQAFIAEADAALSALFTTEGVG